MGHPYHHALSSVRKWGGTAEDYLALHSWFDESKAITADFRHRALRHHAEGVFMAERFFGPTLAISTGRIVPVRLVGEQHVIEDLGFVPSFADWVRCIRPEPWMGRAQPIHRLVDRSRRRRTPLADLPLSAIPTSRSSAQRRASLFQEPDMADYFTHFSCMFDVGTAENAARAVAIRQEQADALEEAEGNDLGFEMEHDPASGPGALWIYSDGWGEPEHVIAFALACAEAFALKGRWGFTWALTCSKPRLDGFGGGAQLLDLGLRQSLAWTDCDHWLTTKLDPASVPPEGRALA